MYISRIRSKGKDGRSYLSVLLRTSTRVGAKVVSKTLAVLTELPDWLLSIVENAVTHGKDAASIAELTSDSQSSLGLRTAESFGSIFAVNEVAKACGIPLALGSSTEGKLALWQVCARVLSPKCSLLGMTRLICNFAATRLLGIKETFSEDDLYANGAWVSQQQSKVEAKLFRFSRTKLPPSSETTSPAPATEPATEPAEPAEGEQAPAVPSQTPQSLPADGLFLYDVTSSYFEGSQNALADFGYNRDKIKGKRQVVMGLLTDADGEPISVSLFPGNTSDLNTFSTQIESLKTTFKQSHITLVGDRGMIRGPQQEEANAAGYNYISALHKSEIQTLLKNGELEMGLFDNIVQETTLEDGRRAVTRCNPVRRDEIAATRNSIIARFEQWMVKANQYLEEHPKAKLETQMKIGLVRLKKGNLNAWMQLETKGRSLYLTRDEEKHKEHAKLDGCYAIVSDLPATVADKEVLHDRYKDLAKVEKDFRTLKHGHLEIRPWHVRKEANTRAHAFTAMLALKIRRRLERAWQGLNITVEEGLAELARLSILETFEKNSGQTVTRHIPAPNALQAKLLSKLGLELPEQAPPKGVEVVTRVKLEDRRKAAQNP